MLRLYIYAVATKVAVVIFRIFNFALYSPHVNGHCLDTGVKCEKNFAFYFAFYTLPNSHFRIIHQPVYRRFSQANSEGAKMGTFEKWGVAPLTPGSAATAPPQLIYIFFKFCTVF